MLFEVPRDYLTSGSACVSWAIVACVAVAENSVATEIRLTLKQTEGEAVIQPKKNRN